MNGDRTRAAHCAFLLCIGGHLPYLEQHEDRLDPTMNTSLLSAGCLYTRRIKLVKAFTAIDCEQEQEPPVDRNSEVGTRFEGANATRTKHANHENLDQHRLSPIAAAKASTAEALQ